MRVVPLVRVRAGQVQFRHDPTDHALVSENAFVGEQTESPCLGVVDNPTPRRFLVLKYRSGLCPFAVTTSKPPDGFRDG